jgi:putative SOS response-associated peptidase YedK
MKWGLIPHWSKKDDRSLSTTNARSEGLMEGGGSGMWGSIKGKKRCAIPCLGCVFPSLSVHDLDLSKDGPRYYEWQTKGNLKLPHLTRMADHGKLMLLAGLYDVAIVEGQEEPVASFTIVTTDACKEFEWLHDRQPVILSNEEALRTWLDTEDQQWDGEKMRGIMEPYHDAAAHPLEWYVSFLSAC